MAIVGRDAMSVAFKRPTGTSSKDAVSHVVADAEIRFEAERQHFYQASLRSNVARVSPLIVDLAEDLGLDLLGALGRLRPNASWPFRWLAQREQSLGLPKAVRVRITRHALGADGPRASGCVLPTTEFGKMRLGLAGGAFQPFGKIGSLLCVGLPDAIEVYVPGVLPQAVTAACIGRRLAEVVKEDLFARREYTIRDASTGVGDFTALLIDAPSIPLPEAWLTEDRSS